MSFAASVGGFGGCLVSWIFPEAAAAAAAAVVLCLPSLMVTRLVAEVWVGDIGCC